MFTNCEINVPVVPCCLWPPEFPKAAVTGDHKLGGLDTRICSLTVTETRSVMGRCCQGNNTASEALREDLSLLFPASGGPRVPCLVATQLQSLSPSSQGLLPCVSVFSFSVSDKNTCHWI